MSTQLRHRASSSRVQRRASRFIARRAEELEDRQMLSASGLEGVFATPAAHHGHGRPSPITNPTPVGLTPAQVSHAYGFDNIQGDGSGQTIAIIDAYGDPNIANDLKVFNQTFGLPDAVFEKVNQDGRTKYPKTNSGWALETALDVEWAHAMAPGAKILLVEARSASLGNLLTAVDYARNQAGVAVVSMSWGAGEFSSETAYDSYFTTPAGHAPVSFVASSGDSGGSTIWPAVSPNVLGVGGTTLTTDSAGDYLGESGWSGSGGGISLYESKPSYQSSVTLSSTQRTSPDVAYNANPYTGFGVYSSVSYNGQSGWFQVGGTSAGAPQWAALTAVADQARAAAGKTTLGDLQATVYGLSSDLHDITTGSNGYPATSGYDLVTGLGTPEVGNLVNSLLTASATPTIQVATANASLGSAGSLDISQSAVAMTVPIPATAAGEPVVSAAFLPASPSVPGFVSSTAGIAAPGADRIAFGDAHATFSVLEESELPADELSQGAETAKVAPSRTFMTPVQTQRAAVPDLPGDWRTNEAPNSAAEAGAGQASPAAVSQAAADSVFAVAAVTADEPLASGATGLAELVCSSERFEEMAIGAGALTAMLALRWSRHDENSRASRGRFLPWAAWARLAALPQR